ncbi:MAG: hypothetical protein H3C68_05035 [Deltaproteobacteria bacterium]|nr:hypothetical protein [Deltaproteobacteria bacterium]MBZ0220092.1 hypothetical protein [Deltaproteobacteria bacterium]
MKVRQELLKYFKMPAEGRLALAKRAGDDTLTPSDEVTVLFVLGFDKDPAVSDAAKKSLGEYPLDGLIKALEQKLDPLVIKKVLDLRDDDSLRIMAALNPGTDDETLKSLAETGPEEVVAAISEDIDLLSMKPFLVEALKKNPHFTLSMAGLFEERLRNPGTAKPGEADPLTSEQIEKDLFDEKKAKADEQNIYKAVSNMTMGQKLKLALCGNKAARELLVKDPNKIIAVAVLKNPRVTEEEVQKVTASKGTSDDLLRQISRNKEWMKSHTIRVGMLSNPKTPLAISLKLLDTVFEKDLQTIAKSKNVSSALASAARRRLEAKAGRG